MSRTPTGSQEPAVFAPKAGEAHCNWHFGDTLTFVLRARDLMGAGLHVHLQGKRDFRFGLFQVRLRGQDSFFFGRPTSYFMK